MGQDRSRAGSGTNRAPYAERGLDLYETPACATEALIYSGVPLPPKIWEPAAGRGAIARVLREHGHHVIATDIADYGAADVLSGVDFLHCSFQSKGVGAIVTNPPYKLTTKFVAKAREMCPHVWMLLRLAFLEGISPRRREILDSGDLAHVLVFRDRLPRMHRDGWDGPKASSNTAFAWFHWDRAHRGYPIIRRITARDFQQDG